MAIALALALGSARAQDIDFGGYHALVIGNNDYEQWTDLTTALRDAREVAGLLERKYGFDVTLLENATRRQIVRALNQLRGKLTENDNLLIYYAGHGHLDGNTGFWIGVDGDKHFEDSWVSVSTITRNLSRMSARHILVVADSCYSGTLTRGDEDTGLRTGRVRSAWLKRMTNKRARLALTSGGLEPVSDVGGGGHSVFAKEFLEALRENDRVLEGQALFGQIKQDVVVNANQTPDYGKIRLASDDGGDFLFVPRDLQLAAVATPDDLGPKRGPGQDPPPDFQVFSLIQNNKNPIDLQAFIETYPDSLLIPYVRNVLAKLKSDQTPQEPARPAPAEDPDPAPGQAHVAPASSRRQATVEPEAAPRQVVAPAPDQPLAAVEPEPEPRQDVEPAPDQPLAAVEPVPEPQQDVEPAPDQPLAAVEPEPAPRQDVAPAPDQPLAAVEPVPEPQQDVEPAPDQALAAVEPVPARIEAAEPAPSPVPVVDHAAIERAVSLSHEQRREIQVALGQLGHDAGTIDGIFGQRSRFAISAWQQGIGDEPTGYLTESQVTTLASAVDPTELPESQALVPAQDPEGIPALSGDTAAQAELGRLMEQHLAKLVAIVDPQTPEPGSLFQDCPECPQMIVVPAGEFMMGSLADEPGRNADEDPQHKVTIARPFAVSIHEVTFAEWDACVADGGCRTSPDDEEWGRGERPVVNVSWHDAQEYVAWLGQKTQQSYRLLSEAEWEYSARAGTTTQISLSSGIAPETANYGRNVNATTTVGSYPPNPWGLYDIYGNVWEWVEDCWNESYEDAPSDGSPQQLGYYIEYNGLFKAKRVASPHCSRRELRGGAWNVKLGNLRSANRDGAEPDRRNSTIGFRVARTLS